MKHLLLLFLVLPTLCVSQVQIGQSLDGDGPGNYFGQAVACSDNGSVIAIGAQGNDNVNGSWAGQVKVFENLGGVWTQIGQDILGENVDDSFGYSVDLSGDGTIFISGSPWNSDSLQYSGQVRVFENIGGNWTQVGQDLFGEAANDNFGWQVSISTDGSTIAVGAPYNSSVNSNAGEVKVYENIGGVWTQVGATLYGISNNDFFGKGVALSNDGSILAVGADQAGMPTNGYVKIFENIGGTWTQIGSEIIGEASGDRSGTCVDISADGSIVAIGADYNDGAAGNYSGHVRVYENTAGTWTQLGSDIDGEGASDGSGRDLAISANGHFVAIGAYANAALGSTTGHVRLFNYTGGSWTQVGNDIDGEQAGDRCGFTAISADGKTVVAGSSDMQYSTQAGRVRVFDFCEYFNNSGTDVIVACNSYTWMDGNTYTSSTNTPTYTLTNAEGCDSIVTLDLTINTMDISVTVNDPTITATTSGALYTWLDCDNGNTPIQGENGQSFTATANGNYAVQIDLNGCVDTSACSTIATVSTEDLGTSINFNVYPNPFDRVIYFSSSKDGLLTLVDQTGKILLETQISTGENTLVSDILLPGIYFLHFEEANGETVIKKLIKL